VDDLCCTAPTVEDLDWLEGELRERYQIVTHKVTDEDQTVSHLGLLIKYDRLNGVCTVSQPAYIEKLISDHDIGTKVKTVPMAPSSYGDTEEESPPCDKDAYLREVYRAMYLATRTRPDILYATVMLATKTSAPTMRDWHRLVHLMCYLNGTREMGLTYRAGDARAYVYIDAAYIVHADTKSHSGAVVMPVDGSAATVFKSSKQKTVATSTCASEANALNDFVPMAIWYRRLLQALGIDAPPPVVNQDNQATIQLATHGPTAGGKSRWMDVKVFAVKEHVDNGNVVLRYCPTADMVADILTKPLQGKEFLRLRNLLLGV
jgi:hypothetical protein